MEIITSISVGLFTRTLYDAAKKILKRDPIKLAIDQTIEELEQDRQNGWFELRELERNRPEIFKNINIIEENNFIKIVTENGILPETASKLYTKLSKKFKEIIKEAALKKTEVFFAYAIDEFDKNNIHKEELNIFLKEFADEINANLEEIKEQLKELKKIKTIIPDIKSVLRRKEISEGEFFRIEPACVDYKQGFIVERKEVNDIINRFEKDKVQLVLGAPASGKSIILKNVGFKLANDGKKVYVVELKKHPHDEIKLFFENIPKIKDKNPIFIVDDAHLYLSECEGLIKNFRSNGKGNLIIGSRNTKEITEEHPKEGAEYKLLSELSKTCIHVQAEDVTEGMIRTFLEKQYGFDEDKIKIISSNLEKYKNDLWFLSWALIAFNKDKESVDIDDIYEKIAKSIEKIKVGKEKAINAEDVFLPLSIFSRFEIPIERYYLEELGIDGNIINKLIGLQEIEETKESKMISILHSSLAELYFRTYLRFPYLGIRTKKNILNRRGQEDIEYCSFYRYITTLTDQRNVIDIFNYLGKNRFFAKKGELKLFEKLVEKGKIQKSIEKGLEKEEDIEKVGNCISNIASTNKEVGLKLANSIDIDALSLKIDKEKDIGKVGSSFLGIAKASQEAAMKLAYSIKIYILFSKINKEEDIEKVGVCLTDIAQSSQEVAMKLANSIDIDALSLKINKEEDIEKVWSCLLGIARASQEVAMKLVDSVSAKIDKEDDINKLGDNISFISYASQEAAMKLANSIDINTLSLKINKEEDIMKVGWCLSGIAEASQEAAMKLANSIDINTLSSKIDKEKDIGKVGWCLSGIAKASQEAAMKFVNRIDIDALSLKINKEKYIHNSVWGLVGIAKASQEVAMKLVDGISKKINEEDDILSVGINIMIIAVNNKELSMKLLETIDIDSLSSKISKEVDIRKVGSSLVAIESASQELANEIVTCLNPKQRKELQRYYCTLRGTVSSKNCGKCIYHE